jgi:hypothetical protein
MLNWPCNSRPGLEISLESGTLATTMPLIKLNRINKGGEILINSDQILFVEVEAKTTTIHMTDNLLFSVEEPLDCLCEKIPGTETGQPGNSRL